MLSLLEVIAKVSFVIGAVLLVMLTLVPILEVSTTCVPKWWRQRVSPVLETVPQKIKGPASIILIGPLRIIGSLLRPVIEMLIIILDWWDEQMSAYADKVHAFVEDHCPYTGKD